MGRGNLRRGRGAGLWFERLNRPFEVRSTNSSASRNARNLVSSHCVKLDTTCVKIDTKKRERPPIDTQHPEGSRWGVSGGPYDEQKSVTETTAVARRTPAVTVAAMLRERGQFPPAIDEDGKLVDPSPLGGLTPRQKRRRLLGILELMACHGDAAAGAEALRHHRWEEEMRKGKAPQRVDVNATGKITVIDTLSAPPGMPIPARSRFRPA